MIQEIETMIHLATKLANGITLTSEEERKLLHFTTWEPE